MPYCVRTWVPSEPYLSRPRVPQVVPKGGPPQPVNWNQRRLIRRNGPLPTDTQAINDRLWHSVSRATCSTAVNSSSLPGPQQPSRDGMLLPKPKRQRPELPRAGGTHTRSRKKGSLVWEEEPGRRGPGAGKVTSPVQGRARSSLPESHP